MQRLRRERRVLLAHMRDGSTSASGRASGGGAGLSTGSAAALRSGGTGSDGAVPRQAVSSAAAVSASFDGGSGDGDRRRHSVHLAAAERAEATAEVHPTTIVHKHVSLRCVATLTSSGIRFRANRLVAALRQIIVPSCVEQLVLSSVRRRRSCWMPEASPAASQRRARCHVSPVPQHLLAAAAVHHPDLRWRRLIGCRRTWRPRWVQFRA